MTRFVRANELVQILSHLAECNPAQCPPRTCICRMQAAKLATRYTVVQGFEIGERPHDRAYHAFTTDEVAKIIAMRDDGARAAEIGAALSRSARSIYRKIAMIKRDTKVAGADVSMTKRQSELLKYVAAFWQRHDYGPSFQEMCDALHLTSKSNVFRMIRSLADQGLVTYNKGRSRSVRVLPQTMDMFAEHHNP